MCSDCESQLEAMASNSSASTNQPFKIVYTSLATATILPLIVAIVTAVSLYCSKDTVKNLKATRRKALRTIEESIEADIGRERLSARQEARGVVFQNKQVYSKTILIPVREIDPNDPGAIIRMRKEKEVIDRIKANLVDLKSRVVQLQLQMQLTGSADSLDSSGGPASSSSVRSSYSPSGNSLS
ncbi:hypothetical protein HDE_14253 [Halotydeus destructor]|nr:hypothetical protein HDE_14253 [Halotydeus destructor]